MTNNPPELPAWATVNPRQRLWLTVLLSILLPPIGLALLWLQTVYKKARNGQAAVVPIWEKAFQTAAVGVLLWLVAPHVLGLGMKLTGNEYRAGLPVCSSSDAKTALTTAFNNAQFARQMHLSVVAIDQAVDKGLVDKTRQCEASLTLNNAETVLVRYGMERRPNGHFMLTLTVIDQDNPTQVAPPIQPRAAQAKPQNGVQWAELIGKHPYDVMTDRQVREVYGESFADKYKGFITGLEVASQTELIDDRYLVGSGCAPQSCGSYESYFAIDVKNGALIAVTYHDGDTEDAGLQGEFRPTPALTAHFNAWQRKF